MNKHRTALSVTISTHRLWKSLWMTLGPTGDNMPKAVGGCGETSRAAAAAPRPSQRKGAARTPAVDAESGTELGRHPLSPASTGPITTTFFYLEEKLIKQQGSWDVTRRPASQLPSRSAQRELYPRHGQLETGRCAATRPPGRRGGTFR